MDLSVFLKNSYFDSFLFLISVSFTMEAAARQHISHAYLSFQSRAVT